MRDVVEAILFIASSGCQWRMLPGDFPPVATVRGYFYRWRDNGLLETINQLLGKRVGSPTYLLVF
jgi:putative transposase